MESLLKCPYSKKPPLPQKIPATTPASLPSKNENLAIALENGKKNQLLSFTRMLESLAGCRTMFLFAVSCKIGAWSVTLIDFISN